MPDGLIVLRKVAHHPSCPLLVSNERITQLVLFAEDVCQFCHGETFEYSWWYNNRRHRPRGYYQLVNGKREPVACPACGSPHVQREAGARVYWSCQRCPWFGGLRGWREAP